MQANNLQSLNKLIVTDGKIKERKKRKFLSYEEIRSIYDVLDAHGPKNAQELARRFDVSYNTMTRVIKAWHDQRGAPVANKGGGMAAAIKRELMDKLAKCKNVSEIKAALRECIGFLE